MRRFEGASDLPKLDLSPPVCLDTWALTFVAGLLAGIVVPALLPALVLASLIVCAGAALRRSLVPERWRVMAVVCPVFVIAGAGAALLHSQAPDPLERLAEIEPGEVTVVGEVASPPEPSGIGYGVDLHVEHLWYEDEELLRGGGLRVQAPSLSVGVGDRIMLEGEISRPEGDDFDYARYLSTEGISGVLYASGVRPLEGGGWIGEVHDRTDRALGYGLHPEEAAIVRGMLIGDRSRISEEVEEDFRRSGITHVLLPVCTRDARPSSA